MLLFHAKPCQVTQRLQEMPMATILAPDTHTPVFLVSLPAGSPRFWRKEIQKSSSHLR